MNRRAFLFGATAAAVAAPLVTAAAEPAERLTLAFDEIFANWYPVANLGDLHPWWPSKESTEHALRIAQMARDFVVESTEERREALASEISAYSVRFAA